jgi:hypothetical protein
MAVIMAGKRIPALPPSLNRIPGISNEELNEELLCRQLEPLMRELLLQPVCLLGENQRRERSGTFQTSRGKCARSL